MAEIKLKEKERSNMLPIILVVVALLALAAWYMMRNRAADGTRPAGDSTTAMLQPASAVQTSATESDLPVIAHVATAGGVRLLAAS